ncbi:hypothetical protein M413DRAFT_362257 [Hebeloma cylindrosporum]|uniref:TEA domain-containing protein n=1 Tax=Hebeloma cylindrosporum TaxID=76867 RepID=A0A0C3C7D3_HEBCY|nr:hypothetical protein M413DRAFT_362257 [Hebeloma cylindrosporum h7]
MDSHAQASYRRNMSTGRKTFKCVPGSKKLERVWPPELEEALLQGLANYRPESNRQLHLLRRFPKRNKQIAEYIRKQTGQTRTAKQVGSRLQQLRETCEDPEILDLIQNKSFPWDVRHPLGRCSTRRGSESSEYSSPTSRVALFAPTTITDPLTSSSFEEPHPLTRTCSSSSLSDMSSASSSSTFTHAPQSVVSVALVLHEHDLYHGSHESAPAFTLDLDERGLRDGGYELEGESVFTRRADLRTTGAIGRFAPVVNLSSCAFSSALKYQCVSRVHRDGEEVYADIASDIRLEPYLQTIHSPIATCTTTLVPEYWGIITSDAKNYHSFTITQEIFSTSGPMQGSGMYIKNPISTVYYTLERGLATSTESHGEEHLTLPVHLAEDQLLCNGLNEQIIDADYILQSSFVFEPSSSSYHASSLHHPALYHQPESFDTNHYSQLTYFPYFFQQPPP